MLGIHQKIIRDIKVAHFDPLSNGICPVLWKSVVFEKIAIFGPKRPLWARHSRFQGSKKSRFLKKKKLKNAAESSKMVGDIKVAHFDPLSNGICPVPWKSVVFEKIAIFGPKRPFWARHSRFQGGPKIAIFLKNFLGHKSSVFWPSFQWYMPRSVKIRGIQENRDLLSKKGHFGLVLAVFAQQI